MKKQGFRAQVDVFYHRCEEDEEKRMSLAAFSEETGGRRRSESPPPLRCCVSILGSLATARLTDQISLSLLRVSMVKGLNVSQAAAERLFCEV